MKQLQLNYKLPRLLTVVIDILLLFAVIFLMKHVQTLLNNDVQINLTEVVTQNKDVITSRLNLEINSLDSTASQLIDRLKLAGSADEETLIRVFLDYSEGRADSTSSISTPDGQAYFSDGKTCDISGRRYFRLAMSGVQNISDRLVSRVDGADIFMICVPLYYEGSIIGSIQNRYTPTEIYDLFALSLFSAQGKMSVINSDGYVLISSSSSDYSGELGNYYRQLYAEGNQDASLKLESDVRANRAGFMETTENAQKTFSAYTPLEGIHDWYLITSVATSAVSPNATIVIKLFYVILMVFILIFGVSLLYFFSFKNKQQTALRRIAFVDEVTGGNTYNKFLLNTQAALNEHARQQYYIMTLDLDKFRYVNNFYGFDFGDQVLRFVYHTFNEALLPGECIARISGDHFVVLLTDADSKRLNRLLDSVKQKDGLMLYPSAGLYPVTDHTESVSLMIDKASTAAQSIKGSFLKSLEYYSDQFDRIIMDNEHLKRSVELALEHNEMLPFYQPKVDVGTGKLVGAEALARWRTPDGRLIPPDQFIPLCEKTGLIIQLDMVIFEKTIRFLCDQLERGIPCVPISVNFSRLHLSSPDFVEHIVTLVRRYQIPSRLIEVELTESAMFENYDIIADVTSQLHAHDLRIAMDDFGSGYSSLNMLKDIPIDILKIDRGFLQDSSSGSRRRIILASIVKMAQELGIDIVVEGVETKESVLLMEEVGCTVAQGYYYAKPMEANQFESLLQGEYLCVTE